MSKPLTMDPTRYIEGNLDPQEPSRWLIRRASEGETVTGIYVRAQTPGGTWHNADISMLDLPSLRAWLRSRGGDNPWAESVIERLLGHDPQDA